MKDIYQVIKNVRLSEKATFLQESNNEITLEVDRKANKLEIKQAVKELFGKTAVSAVPTQAAPAAGKKPSSASRKANPSISSDPGLVQTATIQRSASHATQDFQAKHPAGALQATSFVR